LLEAISVQRLQSPVRQQYSHGLADSSALFCLFRGLLLEPFVLGSSGLRATNLVLRLPLRIAQVDSSWSWSHQGMVLCVVPLHCLVDAVLTERRRRLDPTQVDLDAAMRCIGVTASAVPDLALAGLGEPWMNGTKMPPLGPTDDDPTLMHCPKNSTAPPAPCALN
jgi:hypothetical protein